MDRKIPVTLNAILGGRTFSKSFLFEKFLETSKYLFNLVWVHWSILQRNVKNIDIKIKFRDNVNSSLELVLPPDGNPAHKFQCN